MFDDAPPARPPMHSLTNALSLESRPNLPKPKPLASGASGFG